LTPQRQEASRLRRSAAAALIDLSRERYARSAELAFLMDAADAMSSTLREKPNID
jgi:hypothetical protein